MNSREFYIKQFRRERPVFLSVIRALPGDKLDYKPHERNSTAADIAWFLSSELHAVAEMLETGDMHWNPRPNPKSVDAIAADYEAAANAMEKLLQTMTDAQWERSGGMYFGGKLYKTAPVGDTAWDFLFDAIHHRGQLTAYLRPMGGKVPSTYGPTADEKM